MERKVILSEHALIQIENWLEYYAQSPQSTKYARGVVHEILTICEALIDQPYLGRVSNVDNIRMFSVPPIAIFYEVVGSRILVQSFWDKRQNPDNHPLGKVYEPESMYSIRD